MTNPQNDQWAQYQMGTTTQQQNSPTDEWSQYAVSPKNNELPPSFQDSHVKNVTRAGLVSTFGTYGDILQGMHLQNTENLTPGMEAQFKREHEAPEHLLPFMTGDDEIMPQYSRLPTSEDIDFLLNKAGIEKEEKNALGRLEGGFGKLGGSGIAMSPFVPFSPGQIAASAGGGALSGEIAAGMGYGPTGQAVAEILGSILPQTFTAINAASRLSRKQITKPSGVPLLKAETTRGKSWATITKQRQQNVIKDLNNKAKTLIEARLEERFPILKEVKTGFNFEQRYIERFKEIRAIAKTANPNIEIEPLKAFFKSTAEKYKGIPKPHSDAVEIMKEIKAFNKKSTSPLDKLTQQFSPEEFKNLPGKFHENLLRQFKQGKLKPETTNSLDTMLKIYRSNGRKMVRAYERAHIFGHKDEYIKFLTDYNRAIGHSFAKTLPKDSYWLKLFQDANRDHKIYMDALAAKSLLKKSLGGNPTTQYLTQVGEDPRVQKRLTLYLGKEAAKDISSISADLKLARETVKSIPVKDLSTWQHIKLLSLFIPTEHPAAFATKAAFVGKHAYDMSKNLWGIWLTKPQYRILYKKAAHALAEGDKVAYENATNAMINAFK